jgi:hypothetical protein
MDLSAPVRHANGTSFFRKLLPQMTSKRVASTGKMARRKRFIFGKQATGMSYSHQGSVREQMRFLRGQFLQDGGLPFTDILSEELVSQAL